MFSKCRSLTSERALSTREWNFLGVFTEVFTLIKDTGVKSVDGRETGNLLSPFLLKYFHQLVFIVCLVSTYKNKSLF